MKCLTHTVADAVGVCAYCGRGLCLDCLKDTSSKPLSCSPECAEALSRDERALESILEQTIQSAKASAFYCYVCAALSGGAAVVAWFILPSPFLILFTAGCSVVLLLSGIWYGRTARKKKYVKGAGPSC